MMGTHITEADKFSHIYTNRVSLCHPAFDLHCPGGATLETDAKALRSTDAIHFVKTRNFQPKKLATISKTRKLQNQIEKRLDIEYQPSIETTKITTEESGLFKMGIQNL